MGPSGTRSSSSTMACQHHSARCGAGGPPPPGPRRVRRHAERGGPVLRRDAGVRLDQQWPACPRGRFPGWCCNCRCQTAQGRYPELGRGGPQRLCVLAAEVGGRWGDEAQQLSADGCVGVGASLVEHSGRRGPACCLQRCAGHSEHAGDPGRRRRHPFGRRFGPG